MICSSCNFDNPEGFKFCGSCGSKLAEKSVITKEKSEKLFDTSVDRRNVTILFADISGFTSISEKLDPEEVHEMIDTCFKRLSKIINGYGGTVDKYMGDAIMALFGAPVAHENDPERAIRAALDMQKDLLNFNKVYKLPAGSKLGMRIGINTGRVIAGSIGDRKRSEYTVMGDAVNIASRLESACPVGGILISNGTYKHLKNMVLVREQGSIKVKGKMRPVEVYQVIALSDHLRESKEDFSKMVGREEDLGILKSLADRLIKESAPAHVSIIGEAGMGKGMLVRHFTDYIKKKNAYMIYSDTQGFAGSTSYKVFSDALSGFLSENTKKKDKKLALAELLKRFKVDQKEHGIYLGYLLNINDAADMKKLQNLTPEQQKERIFLSVRELLQKISIQKPLFAIIKDAHSADELSLELLEYILKDLSNAMICVTSRPTDDSNIQQIVRDVKTKSAFKLIHLSGLTPKESGQLIHGILKSKNVSSKIVELVVKSCGGNPMHIREYLRMLTEKDAIKKEKGRWVLTDEEKEPGVPDTLQGLMMARLDMLGPAKAVAQIISVIGQKFSFKIAENLISKYMDVSAFIESLFVLKNNNIVELIDGSNEELRFSNNLLHETIYKSVLKKERLGLHEKIGLIIEEIYTDDVEGHLEELAFHFYKSSDKKKAFEYLSKAGKKASERSSNRLAIDFYKKADEIAEDDELFSDSQRIETMILMSESYLNMGRFDESLSVVNKALNYSGEPRFKTELTHMKSRIFSFKGEYDAALEVLKSIDIKSSEIGKKLMAGIYDTYGWVHYNQGDYKQAEFYAKQSFKFISAFSNIGEIAKSLNLLGVIEYDRGSWDGAYEYFSKSLSYCEEAQNIRGVSACLNNLGLINMNRGEFAPAIEQFKKSLAIVNKLGDTSAIAVTLVNIGNVYLLDTRWDKAKETFKSSLKIAEELGMEDLMPEINALLGVAESVCGDIKKGESLAKEAAKQSRDLGSKFYEAIALRSQGLINVIARKPEKAIDCLSEAKNIFNEIESEFEQIITVYFSNLIETQIQGELPGDKLKKTEKSLKAYGVKPEIYRSLLQNLYSSNAKA